MKTPLDYFYEISKIPRCSKNEGKIRQYLQDWAEENNLNYQCDNYGNLVVYVPPTSDKKDHDPVLLQSHMDMVCIKDNGSDHNFEKDPIQIKKENGHLKANGTTLGADNGIGVALAMSSINYSSRPPLELLFTVDEEQGLNGASNLDGSILSAQKLINLDNEEEGSICIASAGGIPIKIEKFLEMHNDDQMELLEIKIDGFKGGHSGLEIDKVTGNAIDFFVSFLDQTDYDYKIKSIDAGIADNAVPTFANLKIGVKDIGSFGKNIQEYFDDYKENHNEQNATMEINTLNEEKSFIQNSTKIINTVKNIPTGVIKFSGEISGFVETSNNLGVFQIQDGNMNMNYFPRSSNNSSLEEIFENIKDKFEKIGCKVIKKSFVAGWKEDTSSDFVKTIKDSYEEVFKDTVKLESVHAGLECGLILNQLSKGSKAVAIGPNISGAHTTKETCDIQSVERMYNVLSNILSKL